MLATVNLWGFERVTANGPEKGAYYHPKKLFLQGKPSMCKLLTRQRGNKSDVVTPPSQKSSKPKSPSQSKIISAVSKQTESFSSRITVHKQQDDMILPPIDEITMDAAEAFVDAVPSVNIVELDGDIFQSDKNHLLIFEGCQFFPLEEKGYDELENIILRSGGDLLNWQPVEKDNSISTPKRPHSFGMEPPPHLCSV